jgi:hypothetical protein
MLLASCICSSSASSTARYYIELLAGIGSCADRSRSGQIKEHHLSIFNAGRAGTYIPPYRFVCSRELHINYPSTRHVEYQDVGVGIDRRLFCRSTVGSFTDQPSETNTDNEPWNGEKETILLCRVKQCDVFSFSLRNIWTS